VAPEMLTSLPSLHRNLVNKFLQEKSFSSAILEKFMGEIQRNPKLDISEFFDQNGLNDKKRPFLERLKRTLYAYRERYMLVRDYFQRHK
jgi:hypothetical protein